jgi:multicomponent Na+:H+ antiporter subunit D
MRRAMTVAELLPLWVLVPLLAAALAVALRPRHAAWLAQGLMLASLVAWVWLARTFATDGPVDVALAGVALPLGIRLQLDGLALLLLALVATVMLAAGAHAAAIPARPQANRAFWPSWLVLVAGLHAVVLSRDLFNMYVGLELLTLAAVALVASAGGANALRAAMRYLLLAMLGSLAWLLGVAIVYAATGSLDLELSAARAAPGATTAVALGLMLAGLLLKAAIFPLHGWLPLAHATAPGPVSAVLSALVVKAALLLVWRLWFADGGTTGMAAAGPLLAMLGAAAIVYGSLAALRQARLKQVIAFSTVAQLGYLLLVLGMPGALAWQGTVLHLLAHGLAKAAMFLAAANLIRRLGADRIDALAGADARAPLSTLALGLAAVSLMGLPPSGGFAAKWRLLQGAWAHESWLLVAVLLIGSLLAAGYLFRVLAALLARAPAGAGQAGAPVPPVAEWAALSLALGAIALGFAGAPILALAGFDTGGLP